MTEELFPIKGTPQIWSLRPKEIVAIQFIPTLEGVQEVLAWLEGIGRPYQSWKRTTEVLRRGDDLKCIERLDIHMKDELVGTCHIIVDAGDCVVLNDQNRLLTLPYYKLIEDYSKVGSTNADG